MSRTANACRRRRQGRQTNVGRVKAVPGTCRSAKAPASRGKPNALQTLRALHPGCEVQQMCRSNLGALLA